MTLIKEHSELNHIHEIQFNKEIEEQAIVLAAYNIIKELYEKNLISVEELIHIRDKYHVCVD